MAPTLHQLPSLERYRVRCLEPAPLEVRSSAEGGSADWWALADWLEAHVPQEELFQIQADMIRDIEVAQASGLFDQLARASEVVLMALEDTNVDRLDRIC